MDGQNEAIKLHGVRPCTPLPPERRPPARRVLRFYYYVISAVNRGGESTDSSQVSATPHAPLSLAANLAAGGSQIVMSWPNWATNFQLYSTTNLAAPVTWSPVTNSVVNQNGTLNVSVPMDSSTRFFRLSMP